MASGLLEALGPYWAALSSRGVMLAAVALVAVPLQILFPATHRRPKVRSYEFWLDLFYVFQPTILGFVTVYAVSLAAVEGVVLGSMPVLVPQLAGWPLWLQAVIALWLFDLVVYWRHRLEHTLPFLWPIHAVHHTAEQVDFLTTLRLHPLELFLGAVLNAVVANRVGLSPFAASLGYFVYLHWNYFIHTNVNVRFEGPLRYVLLTPFMHRWHHAKEPEARDTNFGVVFAWNDWLFGSAYHPAREPVAYGIDYPRGEAVGQSYWGQLIYPFRVAWVRLAPRLGLTSARSVVE